MMYKIYNIDKIYHLFSILKSLFFNEDVKIKWLMSPSKSNRSRKLELDS
jgi:hypothetical protein